MQQLRLGLLSTASIGAAIVRARSEDAPFRVVAVASRERRRAEAFAREHGVPRAFGSYDELLAEADVDAVYIALPNALHHRWTMRALRAGKHVLCEKPYSFRPEDVGEAWSEAERRNLVLTEGYMWRHSPQTALLRRLLPSVGEVRAVHAVFTARIAQHDIRWTRTLGGGALLDVGCYCVSAARLVLGEPEAVHGEAHVRGEVDASFAGTLRFGAATATFQCSLAAPLVETIDVIGADGTIHVPNAFVFPTGVVMLNEEKHRVDPGDAYREELDDFCAAVRGERRPLVGGDEMHSQAHVLSLLRRDADITASSRD